VVTTYILIALAITSFLSIFFGFYAIKFGIILLSVQDQIEESLDVLDTQYGKISEILEMPVYSDNPQIRSVVTSITTAKESILSVGNILADHSSQEENKEIAEN
jgi:hypothetical protein